jgi:hypothetical protein
MFIDGIDEYKGDYFELLGIFSSIESSSCAKAVLSSRPTPECIAAFSHCQSLRLQDLTRDDIRFYVDQQLMKRRHVQDMRRRLEELPTDLKKLYQYMLDRLEPAHQ